MFKWLQKLWAPNRVPATCSPSCWVGFSSCIASQTCRLLLAHSRHRNMYPQPDNMRQWQTYKYQILFSSCLPCPALTCTTIPWISWAVARFYGNFRKFWGTHKHSIHKRLSLHVASRTADYKTLLIHLLLLWFILAKLNCMEEDAPRSQVQVSPPLLATPHSHNFHHQWWHHILYHGWCSMCEKCCYVVNHLLK